MLLTEQDIRSTHTSYDTPDNQRDAFLHEVYTHLTNAAAALDAGMQETPGPINASPFSDLSLARAELQFALSFWED